MTNETKRNYIYTIHSAPLPYYERFNQRKKPEEKSFKKRMWTTLSRDSWALKWVLIKLLNILWILGAIWHNSVSLSGEIFEKFCMQQCIAEMRIFVAWVSNLGSKNWFNRRLNIHSEIAVKTDAATEEFSDLLTNFSFYFILSLNFPFSNDLHSHRLEDCRLCRLCWRLSV